MEPYICPRLHNPSLIPLTGNPCLKHEPFISCLNPHSSLVQHAINIVLYGFSPACWQSFCSKHCISFRSYAQFLSYLPQTSFQSLKRDFETLRHSLVSLFLPQNLSLTSITLTGDIHICVFSVDILMPHLITTNTFKRLFLLYIHLSCL